MLDFTRISALAGGPLEGFAELSSTNSRLKELAREGAPSGLALVAERQTAGRGRLGRSFHSPEGTGLYLSVLLSMPSGVPPEGITAEAAVFAARAIAETVGTETEIKWINDLYNNGKKVAGILCESGVSATGLFVVVGIGVNCTEPFGGFPAELPEAGCLSDGPIDREALAAALIRRFRVLSGVLTEDAWAEYRRRSLVLGKTVTWLVQGQEKGRGQAVDITKEGHLLVQTANGQEISLSTGEISLRLSPSV